MTASVQCRHQDRSLGMAINEAAGDLATFFEMRKLEKESNGFVHILHGSDGFDDSTASSNPNCSVGSDTILRETLLNLSTADNFLDAETQKSDHDWLIAPPRTPSIPSLEISMEMATSSAVSTAQIYELENQPDVPSSSNDASGQAIASTSDTSSVSTIRKPSSAKQKSSASRSSTPTGRVTFPASRSSTPTSRGVAATNNKARGAPPVRSSTPTRVAARVATPVARSSVSVPSSSNKSASRSATPTQRSSISSSGSAGSAASGRSSSSSVTKTVSGMSRNMGGSRVGIIPMVKSRPKPSSNVPVISSDDAPSNVKMAMPKRPSSASRGRTTASGSQFSSSNLATARPQQKSCSPSRGRIKDGGLDMGKTAIFRSRVHSNGSDDVNPVLMGTKMVERVVNMRKLAPPKHDNDYSHDNSSGKSSSQDNSGFGRSLSKKSLDMAIRHMDIRRSISGNLKTIVTSNLASSLPSRRTVSTKTSTTTTATTSASNSPLATSSSTSSEPSVHNISHDVEVYDFGSERELN